MPAFDPFLTHFDWYLDINNNNLISNGGKQQEHASLLTYPSCEIMLLVPLYANYVMVHPIYSKLCHFNKSTLYLIMFKQNDLNPI